MDTDGCSTSYSMSAGDYVTKFVVEGVELPAEWDLSNSLVGFRATINQGVNALALAAGIAVASNVSWLLERSAVLDAGEAQVLRRSLVERCVEQFTGSSDGMDAGTSGGAGAGPSLYTLHESSFAEVGGSSSSSDGWRIRSHHD